MASSMAFRSLYRGANPPKLLSGFLGSRQSMLLKPLVSTGSSISSTANATRLLKLHPGFGISKFSTTIDGTIQRGICSVRCYNSRGDSVENPNQDKANELKWPILRRWNTPWPWKTVSLTSMACGLSFVCTGLIKNAALPYIGIQIEELTIDEEAELLFLTQGIATAAALGVLFSLTRNFPHRDDLFLYDLREPFNLRKGWLLWAGIGSIGAIGAAALTVAALSYFGWLPERKTDNLVRLLPFIGASPVSTACLVGTTGILAPFLEETMFRGFLMVSRIFDGFVNPLGSYTCSHRYKLCCVCTCSSNT